MTRAEHLAWAKARALEYANRGDTTNTIASMLSDLEKHPETASSAGLGVLLGIGLAMGKSGVDELRRFVNGFN